MLIVDLHVSGTPLPTNQRLFKLQSSYYRCLSYILYILQSSFNFIYYRFNTLPSLLIGCTTVALASRSSLAHERLKPHYLSHRIVIV